MARKKNVDPDFERLKKQMPEDVKRLIDAEGIRSMEDLFMALVEKGFDPMKMMTPPENVKEDEINLEDYAIDKGSELGMIRELLFGSNSDESDEDEDWEDNNNFMDQWYDLPEGLLLDGDCLEYHLRVKLNNAPVPVWREMLVPSNVSLELLALLIIEAMGWENSHLHQFRKGEVLYKSTENLQESQRFAGFGMPRMMYDANKFSLRNVLKEKGDRIKFEYDFGDSWEHEVWVKGIREYDDDEEPEAVVLNGKGACPPEDCGGVWGYGDILNILQKKRKTKEEKERLEWFGIDRHYDPNFFGLELAQEAVEDFWWYAKDEADERREKNL
jgi:hypothetical protein